MFTRTRLNVTFIRTMPVSFHSIWAEVRAFWGTSWHSYTKSWATFVFWYVTPCSMVHRYQSLGGLSVPLHQTIRRHIVEDCNLNFRHYLRGPLTELLSVYCNNSAISSSAGPISYDITQ
jgi:hypothetical protein